MPDKKDENQSPPQKTETPDSPLVTGELVLSPDARDLLRELESIEHRDSKSIFSGDGACSVNDLCDIIRAGGPEADYLVALHVKVRKRAAERRKVTMGIQPFLLAIVSVCLAIAVYLLN